MQRVIPEMVGTLYFNNGRCYASITEAAEIIAIPSPSLYAYLSVARRAGNNTFRYKKKEYLFEVQ